jgi:hypothetical protein
LEGPVRPRADAGKAAPQRSALGIAGFVPHNEGNLKQKVHWSWIAIVQKPVMSDACCCAIVAPFLVNGAMDKDMLKTIARDRCVMNHQVRIWL